MVGKTAEYYRTHPRARAKKKAYDTEFNKKKEQREKRSELTQKNREHDKKYGKASRKGKDLSHTSHGLVYKSSSANRGSKSDTAGDRRARVNVAKELGKSYRQCNDDGTFDKIKKLPYVGIYSKVSALLNKD